MTASLVVVLLTLAAGLSTLSPTIAAASQKTLGQIRTELLGQDVVRSSRGDRWRKLVAALGRLGRKAPI